MNIKQTVIGMLAGIGAIATMWLAAPVATVGAAKCAGVNTSIISCPTNEKSTKVEDSGVWQLLLLTLNIMTAGVGILAVGGIVYGSVLYTSAGDKAEQTKKAISIITNVVIGIIAYALMYLVLQWLIPGGIFS